MGRNRRRVEYELDSGDVHSLTDEEIRAVLRAADEITGQGGRTLLTKILKGSKEKRVLELGLNECPSYGFYKDLTTQEIGYTVDFMIRKGYLTVEYSGRLPVLVFTETGWELEKQYYAQEVYRDFCQACKKGDERCLSFLKETVNRQVVLIVLELLKEQGEAWQIPMLKKWQQIEVRKIREGLDEVIAAIQRRTPPDLKSV